MTYWFNRRDIVQNCSVNYIGRGRLNRSDYYAAQAIESMQNGTLERTCKSTPTTQWRRAGRFVQGFSFRADI